MWSMIERAYVGKYHKMSPKRRKYPGVKRGEPLGSTSLVRTGLNRSLSVSHMVCVTFDSMRG